MRIPFGMLEREAVEATLSTFSRKGHRWEWGDDSRGLHTLSGPPKELSSVVAQMSQDNHFSKARKNEFKFLAELLRNAQMSWAVVALANVTGYLAGENAQDLEIDGLLVGLDERRQDVVVALLECKHQRSRARALCVSELSERMVKLELTPGVRRGQVQSKAVGQRGAAWVYLRASYA